MAQRRKVAKQATLPAPTNGWFVGTNLANAPAQTAYVLDNWFPSQDFVRARRGSIEYASGMTDPVEQIMVYETGGVTQEFGCAGGKIYNFTGGGPVGAAAVSGLVSNNWQSVQFTTTGGTFLRAVNGTDTPQLYDGAAWSTAPAITGVTPENLSSLWIFKNRVYFAEKNTLNAWYLPVDSIGGAATKFPLGGVFSLGGSILTGASWAIDANSGLYETCIFITDQGEVAMYDGAYPGATEWTLKGVYRIGKPLGRDCIMKAGGDLAVMTEDGIVPMSKVMTLDRIALANEAVTQPIQPAWRDAVTERTALSGWSITVWPLESMGIVNLPQIDANDRQQFVANVRSGAWCRFTGWDARCFKVSGNKLLFGASDGRVMQGETTGADDGALYSAKMIWSWQDFKQGALRKQVKAVRPVYRATYNALPSVEVLSDYDSTTNAAPAAATAASSGAAWGSAVWGVDLWPGTVVQRAAWTSVTGFGAVLAPVMQVSVSSTTAPNLRVLQMDVLYETGEALG